MDGRGRPVVAIPIKFTVFEQQIEFIRSRYGTTGVIPLHEPRFRGNEKQYVIDCIDSTFVSSVGRYVDQFESMIAEYTGAGYAVATVNGTSALHAALVLAGVRAGDEVITQALSFAATANAIAYCGAVPCFLDVDRSTLGLSSEALADFLETSTSVRDGIRVNRITGRRIAACVPMHTFGHPCDIRRIAELCREHGIPLVEDAAESLGSRFEGRHTGTFGRMGIFSFNGNKTVTCGGGGVIVTDDKELAARAKHLTTTAKLPHKWEYEHDMVGYNYRMPNLNAALACAQLEQLDGFVARKRELAESYITHFEDAGIPCVREPAGARSNYWLNAIILPGREERDRFLEETGEAGVMTRPIWRLLHSLPHFSAAPCGDLTESRWLEDRVVNIPSSVP